MRRERGHQDVRCGACGEVIAAGTWRTVTFIGIRYARVHIACALRLRREKANHGPMRFKQT
jgi:hypothetical protein